MAEATYPYVQLRLETEADLESALDQRGPFNRRTRTRVVKGKLHPELYIDSHFGVLCFSARIDYETGGGGYGIPAYMLAYQERDTGRMASKAYVVPLLQGLMEVAGCTEWADMDGVSVRVRVGDEQGSQHNRVFAIGHRTRDAWLDIERWLGTGGPNG